MKNTDKTSRTKKQGKFIQIPLNLQICLNEKAAGQIKKKKRPKAKNIKADSPLIRSE